MKKKNGTPTAATSPEDLSPGTEAAWLRVGPDEWRATYRGREIGIVRASTRSPMLSGFVGTKKVFGGVRFVPTAQQRCEAIVRLGLGA